MDDTTKRVAATQLERVIAYQAVFSGPMGEIVLEDLKRMHHFYESCFDKDPLEMARKCGEDNVVKRILSMFKVDVTKSQEALGVRDAEQNGDGLS